MLSEYGVKADIAYPNILFAQLVGLESYALLDEQVNAALFAGDWLFAQELFDSELDLDTYISTLRSHIGDDTQFQRILEMRAVIPDYIERCLREYAIADYDIVGFTTTFEQNLASLALSKVIKDKYPDKIIVFGGANCEEIMGYQLHRSFPWIDYVCTGEGERCFPALIRRLDEGRNAHGVKGIVYRDGQHSEDNGLAEVIGDVDSLPIPDYDDYFATLQDSNLSERLNPSLLIETSRGCWWGAKTHCTFCGLNGGTIHFRSKSETRAVDELRYLMERYGLKRFIAVDNIMDMRYFRSVLPKLRDNPLGVSVFFETKSNLKKEQVALLREAGICAIQPGIESLSSHVLRLMRKGVSGIQNIELLKWCKEYGVTVAWNLLFGFPGENFEDYDEMSTCMDALFHLEPPHSIGPIRMDRFSPYFKAPELFGMSKVRPFAIYSYIYPLPMAAIRDLVYFFEFDYIDERGRDTYLGDVKEKVAQWRGAKPCSLTKAYGGEDELLIIDTRPNRIHGRIALNGIQRQIYDFCEQRRGFQTIMQFLDRHYVLPGEFAEWLQQFLGQMVEWRLMVQEGTQYLSVATIE